MTIYTSCHPCLSRCLPAPSYLHANSKAKMQPIILGFSSSKPSLLLPYVLRPYCLVQIAKSPCAMVALSSCHQYLLISPASDKSCTLEFKPSAMSASHVLHSSIFFKLPSNLIITRISHSHDTAPMLIDHLSTALTISSQNIVNRSPIRQDTCQASLVHNVPIHVQHHSGFTRQSISFPMMRIEKILDVWYRDENRSLDLGIFRQPNARRL